MPRVTSGTLLPCLANRENSNRECKKPLEFCPFFIIFGTKQPSLFAKQGRKVPLGTLGMAISSHRPLMVTSKFL